MTQTKKASPAKEDKNELTDILTTISGQLKTQDEKFDKMEKRMVVLEKGEPTFKDEATKEDIASAVRKDIPEEMCKIVDSILGQDWNIIMEGYKDKPGYMLKLIVPERLSLLPEATRPTVGEDGKYIKDDEGNNVMEAYQPDDVRAKPMSGTDNYDTVAKYCETVRGNIVSTYDKLKKQLPALQIK